MAAAEVVEALGGKAGAAQAVTAVEAAAEGVVGTEIKAEMKEAATAQPAKVKAAVVTVDLRLSRP